MTGVFRRFQHDCHRCVYLGDYWYDNAWFDLYWCPQSEDGSCETVIARFGNQDWDYTSHMPSENDPNNKAPLHEAKRRARENGLGYKPGPFFENESQAYVLFEGLDRIYRRVAMLGISEKVHKQMIRWCYDQIAYDPTDTEAETFWKKAIELLEIAKKISERGKI